MIFHSRHLKFFVILIFLLVQTGTANDWQKVRNSFNENWHNGFFISDKIGWLVSHEKGVVSKTFDAGKSWRIQSRLESGYLESLYFVNEKEGWLVGDGGRIYSTANGGETWNLYQTPEKSYAFYYVSFFDRKRGFAAGINSKNRTGVWMETTDGGKIWRERTSEIGITETVTDAGFFLNNKIGWLFGAKKFLQTSDSGFNWKIYETNQNRTARGLFFFNSQKGWAVGHQGLILKTVDGRNWRQQKIFTESLLRSVVFINAKIGYIAGNRDKNGTALWKTVDGGENWTAQMDFVSVNLHRLILTERKLWLIGEDGLIAWLKV